MTKDSQSVRLLQGMIQIPSYSREEAGVADLIQESLIAKSIEVKRKGHNLFAHSKNYDIGKVNVLLCSHHDTVQPNDGYTRNPFDGRIEDDKIYGLGSNDAGASLVAMIAAFEKCFEKELPFNLWLAAVAEEEISGEGGITHILPDLPPFDLVIVGEPTSLRMAVAEKGLLVVDGYATGIPGHAAHGNTLNPIYQAAKDILQLKNLIWEKTSEFLGSTKLSITQISAGTQHNQVPAECHFVVDVRINENYTNEEVFDRLQMHTISLLQARSFRLRSSGIQSDHPILKVAKSLGVSMIGSSTLSDQALIPYPSIKIGPGDSHRSHTADEFIYLDELKAGAELYERLILNYRPSR